MRQMPHGQWVAFENNQPHAHDAPPVTSYSAKQGHRTQAATRGVLGGVDFEEVDVEGIRGPSAARTGLALPTTKTSKSGSSAVVPYVVAAIILAGAVGLWPDGYWYCANSGPAQPHHTGSAATRGDHACNHFEVWFNGNPSRPTGR
jgi:hypothetical protein